MTNIKNKILHAYGVTFISVTLFYMNHVANAADSITKENILGNTETRDRLTGLATFLNYVIGIDLALGLMIGIVAFTIIGAKSSIAKQSGNDSEFASQMGQYKKLALNTFYLTLATGFLAVAGRLLVGSYLK